MNNKRYIDLHDVKKEKLTIEDKYDDFFMKRYIKLLLEDYPIEKLNIDFLLDISTYYSKDENNPNKVNQKVKKCILLLRNKKIDKINKNDKKIIANCLKKLFDENLECLVDIFLEFLSCLLKYIIYKEKQDDDIIIRLILKCFMFLKAFSNWKEIRFRPGRKINRFHRNSYYALEYIKNNYDELYKKALLEANIEIKDKYLNLISLDEILAHKNEYYFVHKYIYSKEAKNYYFKELDKNDV